MPKHRKTWNKKKIIEVLVGSCRYCEKEIINTDSFVSFYKSGHAHYQCMKNEDEKQQKDQRHNQY